MASELVAEAGTFAAGIVAGFIAAAWYLLRATRRGPEQGP